ncbi:putative aromatic-amino-acid transaminase [Medicago truncatula]|nr:probable aminotransferase TAT2 isoform X1 [Medicago truncatula]AET03031.1 tyrosine/nicotianamine family aminotransferase [Medicago truncatula]RHN40915.1 putative aromatic-amino-acid transaminase [Medicago truncatula]
MESGVGTMNHECKATSTITIKGILSLLMESVGENNDDNSKRVISLGMGDPTLSTCFPNAKVAEEAVADALCSGNFHGYAPTAGLLQARNAIAKYLSDDLPYELSSDDVFITCGCTQAIDVSVALLSRPGANILLPRPGFPIYELCAAFRQVEVRHYDLLPEKGWEVDLDAIETLVDQNTVALVIINPGNPCGNVYTYHHLEKIAETAKRLGTIVIADEVYGHLAFGDNPFVPMGVFGSTVPVITLGSLSKRWIVPGWRLGWFVTNDPSGTFRKPKVVERIKKYFDLLGGPATFIQAAVPRIITQTEEVFFRKTIDKLRHTADICCQEMEDIPCISFPCKPQGSMAMMVELNLSLLEDISDDIDFCFKLAKEESVIILPGTAVGLKDWIRITFAADPSALRDGMQRIKSFSQRHARKQ